MAVEVYYSSVTSNLEMKKRQQKIEMILESKKISSTFIDIASSKNEKDRMRELIGDPKALPPQLFNNGEYCGDYSAFENAIELETLEEFLKLK